MNNSGEIRYGTLGGILLNFFFGIAYSDLMRSILLAAVGATVSYLVSLVLNKILRRK